MHKHTCAHIIHILYAFALITVILAIKLELVWKDYVCAKTLHFDKKYRLKASLRNGTSLEYVNYTVRFSKYLNMSEQLIYNFNIFENRLVLSSLGSCHFGHPTYGTLS